MQKRPSMRQRPAKRPRTVACVDMTYRGDVQLGERVYASLRSSPTLLASAEACAHTALRARKEEDGQSMLQLVAGTIRTLYPQHAKERNVIVVNDDGRHTCRPCCPIRPISVRLFSAGNPRCPDGVHVCFGGNCSRAPDYVHKLAIGQPIASTFFVCESSGVVHVCTEEACTEKKIASVDGLTCPLSGKVYAAKDAGVQLSHGWKEDPWKTKVPDHSEMIIGDVEIKVPIDPVATAHGYIRQLFPGHAFRDKAEERFRDRVMLNLYLSWDKMVRTTKLQPHRRPWLYLRMQAAAVHATHELSKISMLTTLDPDQLDRIAHTYAKVIKQFYDRLLLHTDINKQEPIRFFNFVVACLYLMRSSFRVDDTVIFHVDPFLACFLPPASSLEHYEDICKTSFTDTKTRIQKAILDAIRVAGIAPELVCPAIVSVHDLL